MWGIIGGSGFEKFDGFEKIEDLNFSTPFGNPSAGIKKVKVNDSEAIFIPRHGTNHLIQPSEINFRANIYALKSLGCRGVISASAVGSLKEDLKPGDLVIPNQYIDRTKSLREHTFCGNGFVGHTSLADPTCLAVSNSLKKVKNNFSFSIHFDKTYVCIEGPYFSTRSESHYFRQINADIIGMTNFPEYALAREAGLCYVPASFVTDFDCWNEEIPHVTLEEVLEVMKKNNEKAFQVIKYIVSNESTCSECPEGGLKNSLMTPDQLIPKETKEWLEVLKS